MSLAHKRFLFVAPRGYFSLSHSEFDEEKPPQFLHENEKSNKLLPQR